MTTRAELIAQTRKAMEHAYAPYSHFYVGACLVTKSGRIYTGVNIENSSYGLTNCAERTAIFKAISEGEREFAQLLVVGNTIKPLAPCGACRQVIAEFCAPDMPVILVGNEDTQLETTIAELLPYGFSGKVLL